MSTTLRQPIALIISLVAFCPVYAQDYKVSPLYFGPNALPVPEMPGDMPISRFCAELSFDFSQGFHGDVTETILAELNIPLFSKRVSLSLWMPVVEFYTNTPESLE